MRIAGTIDMTGEADVDLAIRTLTAVAEKYSGMGIRFSAPVTLVIEDIPIMGATEPSGSGYRLHVASFAVRSGMLDGLVAHEMGHMICMEQHHPSHDPTLHSRVVQRIRVPPGSRRGFTAVAREAINHVEDIYADDLAFEIIGDSRAGVFFSDWIDRSSIISRDPWQTVGNGISIAFALGNMERHGVVPEREVRWKAEAFGRKAGLESLPLQAATFRGLPKTDDVAQIEEAMTGLLSMARNEGVRREAGIVTPKDS